MTDYHLAFWNVENLFDIEDSPRRTDKLQRTIGGQLAGWNEAVLDRKLARLAAIIGKMNGNRGPDLLGVCEIENAWVLERLTDALACLGRDYAVAHDNSGDRRGIDVAFIYDAGLFEAREQFSHEVMKRYATRDLFQVTFALRDGQHLVVIGNHWPSRSGGHLESEPYRIMAAETLSYFHERIREIKGRNVAVVAMGDFNDEPFDRSLRDYALSTRQRNRVMNASSPRFYNLMWSLAGDRRGTYYYNNDPNLLDQFLVSRGLIGGDSGLTLIEGSAAIEAFPEMTRQGDYPGPVQHGRPSSRFDPDGFSDHFPISMGLREV